MKVLVTGAKGFVGKNLCSQLNFSPLYSIVPQELLYFNPEETSLQ